MAEKVEPEEYDSEKVTVPEYVVRVISIVVPIGFIAIVVSGLISGKYTLKFPGTGDMNMMIMGFVILSFVSSIGKIFYEKKKGDAFSGIYSTIFIFSILGGLFIDGLSLFTFLGPFLIFTFISSWLNKRVKRAHYIATGGGTKDLAGKDFIEALQKGGADLNALKKGTKMIKAGLDRIEDLRSDLNNKLTVTIDLPKGYTPLGGPTVMPQASGPTIVSVKGGEIQTQHPNIDWKAQGDYFSATSAPVALGPVDAIDLILKRMKKIREGDKEATYGPQTTKMYRAILLDASKIYQEAFQFAWEMYKVLFIGKPWKKADGEFKMIYQRFKEHESTLEILVEILEAMQEIMEGMEKQNQFLMLNNEQVNAVKVLKTDTIGETAVMAGYLKDGTPGILDSVSDTVGPTTFQQFIADAKDRVEKYKEAIDSIGTHPHPKRAVRGIADWPTQLGAFLDQAMEDYAT
ncbi:MAG: hypothetical protein ABIF92_02610 [archaeon]